jgi:3-hydroxybutyryl-CoA dehydratase
MTGRAAIELTVDDSAPVRRLTVDEIVVGDAVVQDFVFDRAVREAFARVANDRAPLHEDERFAHAHGYRGPILQGLCVSSRFSRLIGMYLPGEAAILERIDLKFRHPIYEGIPVRFRAEVLRILRPMKVIRLAVTAACEGIVHVSGEAQCLMR